MVLQAAIVADETLGLAVPAQAAVSHAKGQTVVYVMEEHNRVKAQPVDLGQVWEGGQPLEKWQEIQRGLKLGDRIVVKGAARLRDGDRVIAK
jgi:multidrug efflux pump subunit AcrA (membrane-fusion protein)